jgi:hypothetical protein
VIIRNLNFKSVAGLPQETDAVLIVNPYRELALTISQKDVKIQASPGAKVVKGPGGGQVGQSAPGLLVQFHGQFASSRFGGLSGRDIAGAVIAIAPNGHFSTLAHIAKFVNRAGTAGQSLMGAVSI